MQLLLVQGLGSILALLLFVVLVSPERSPFSRIEISWRGAWALRGGRAAIGAILAVVVINYVEGVFDPALSRWLGWDATTIVRALEDGSVGRLQTVIPRALLLPLAVIYVPGYLATLISPLVLWTSAEDRLVAGRYTVAFVLNYLVAFPFFLFVPVREVGWSELTAARPMLDVIWPGITAELRAGSPLDNCFPSMHVSCVVTTLWYVHGHGPRRLKWIAWVVVPSIALSTMALGIHWVADVIAGILVGVGCSFCTDRVFRRRNAAAQP